MLRAPFSLRSRSAQWDHNIMYLYEMCIYLRCVYTCVCVCGGCMIEPTPSCIVHFTMMMSRHWVEEGWTMGLWAKGKFIIILADKRYIEMFWRLCDHIQTSKLDIHDQNPNPKRFRTSPCRIIYGFYRLRLLWKGEAEQHWSYSYKEQRPLASHRLKQSKAYGNIPSRCALWMLHGC